MWASMVPSPKGTSVMIWFIFTAWAGAAVLPGVLLADLLGGVHPLVGQERVLAPRRRTSSSVFGAGAAHGSTKVAPRVQEPSRRQAGQAARRPRRRAARRAMACSSAATECTT